MKRVRLLVSKSFPHGRSGRDVLTAGGVYRVSDERAEELLSSVEPSIKPAGELFEEQDNLVADEAGSLYADPVTVSTQPEPTYPVGDDEEDLSDA